MKTGFVGVADLAGLVVPLWQRVGLEEVPTLAVLQLLAKNAVPQREEMEAAGTATRRSEAKLVQMPGAGFVRNNHVEFWWYFTQMVCRGRARFPTTTSGASSTS